MSPIRNCTGCAKERLSKLSSGVVQSGKPGDVSSFNPTMREEMPFGMKSTSVPSSDEELSAKLPIPDPPSALRKPTKSVGMSSGNVIAPIGLASGGETFDGQKDDEPARDSDTVLSEHAQVGTHPDDMPPRSIADDTPDALERATITIVDESSHVDEDQSSSESSVDFGEELPLEGSVGEPVDQLDVPETEDLLNLKPGVSECKRPKMMVAIPNNGGEYNKSKRESQPDTDDVDPRYLRNPLDLTWALESVKASSDDAWKAFEGPDKVAIFRDKIAKNEIDLEEAYSDAVVLWYLASELSWMKSAVGKEPFALSDSDTELICSQLDNEHIVKRIRDSTIARVYTRQQRYRDTYIAYGVNRFHSDFPERHPFAKLPTLCKNIPNEDVAFAIINHRIGRFIDETLLVPRWRPSYGVSSAIENVRETLLDIGSGSVFAWLYGDVVKTHQFRDWHSNVGNLMLNPRTGYFEEDADGILRLNSQVVDFSVNGYKEGYTERKVRLEYRGIGRYFAISLIEGMPLGAVFNYGFYLVLSDKMNVERLTKMDLQLDDSTYYEKWKVFGDCEESEEMNCHNVCERFPNTVMTSTDGKRDLVKNGSEIALSEINIGEYSKVLIQDHMYNRHKLIYEEIMAGFNEMLPENVLDFVSIEHLKLIYQGNVAGLTAEQLTNSIEWPMDGMYAENQNGYKWLNELFESEGQTFRNRFVRFATGLMFAPKGGFVKDTQTGGMIYVNDIGSPNRIYSNGVEIILRPSSNSLYVVRMPQYKSKEQLRDMLLDSFRTEGISRGFSYNEDLDREEWA